MLIFAGCSFTDPRHVGYVENDIKVWPEIVSKHRKQKHINVAKSGASNELILYNVLDAIKHYEDKEDLEVYVLWTSTARMNIYERTLFFHLEENLTEYDKKYYHMTTQIREMLKDKSLELKINKIISNNNRTIEFLDRYCDLKGIKITHGFGLDYFSSAFTFDGSKKYFNREEIKKYQHLLKMPNIKNNVGFVWAHLSENNLYISQEDLHPNQEGHNYIADVFLGLASGALTDLSRIRLRPVGFIYD